MTEPATVEPHAVQERRSLVTPEGVDLSLGLATGGQRIAAFVIDLMIMLIALVLLNLVLTTVAQAAFRGGSLATMEIAGALWLLGFFLIRNGYFILLEGGRRAATIGKRAVGLRVVARNGERLSLDSVIARNLMREVEVYLPVTFIIYTAVAGAAGSDPLLSWLGAAWVLLFLFFPLFNHDRLRIGDLLAGTWVVSIARRQLAWDLAVAQPADAALAFTPDQLDVYGVYELQTLERVLREAQPEAVELVATTIRQKIGHEAPASSYDFLTAYYLAARAHMERGLLFGRRRANKFDR